MAMLYSRPAVLCRHGQDRKSTRLNSSHGSISYAVFCLKKKNIELPFVLGVAYLAGTGQLGTRRLESAEGSHDRLEAGQLLAEAAESSRIGGRLGPGKLGLEAVVLGRDVLEPRIEIGHGRSGAGESAPFGESPAPESMADGSAAGGSASGGSATSGSAPNGMSARPGA